MKLKDFLLNEETYDFDKSLKKIVDEIYDFVKKSTLGILPIRSKSIKDLIEREASKIRGYKKLDKKDKIVIRVISAFSKEHGGKLIQFYDKPVRRLEFTFPLKFKLSKNWEKEKDYIKGLIKHELTHLLDSLRIPLRREKGFILPPTASLGQDQMEFNAFIADLKGIIKKEPQYDKIKNREELKDFFSKCQKKYRNDYFFSARSDLGSVTGYKKIIRRLSREGLLPKSFTGNVEKEKKETEFSKLYSIIGEVKDGKLEGDKKTFEKILKFPSLLFIAGFDGDKWKYFDYQKGLSELKGANYNTENFHFGKINMYKKALKSWPKEEVRKHKEGNL